MFEKGNARMEREGLGGELWSERRVCAAEKNTLICTEDEREMRECKYIFEHSVILA